MFGKIWSLEVVAGVLLATLPLNQAAPQDLDLLRRQDASRGTVLVNTATDFSIRFGSPRNTPQQIACPANTFITAICGVEARGATPGGFQVSGLGSLSVKCSDGSSADPIGIGDGERCLPQPNGFTRIGLGHGSFVDRLRDINLPDNTDPPNFIGSAGGDFSDVVVPVEAMKLVALSVSYGGTGNIAHEVTFTFTSNSAPVTIPGGGAGSSRGTVLANTATDFSIKFGELRNPAQQIACPANTFITSICGVEARGATPGGFQVSGLGSLSVKCSDGSSVDPFAIGDGERCLPQPNGFTRIGLGHGSFVDRLRDTNLPDSTNPPNFIGSPGGDFSDVVAPVEGMKLVAMSISYGGTGNIAHEVTFSFQKAQSNLVDDPNNGGNNGGLKRITLKKTITHNDQAATSAQAAMIVSGQADALVDILSVNAQFSECIDIPHLPRFRGRDPPRRIGVWGEHGFSATCDSQQCLETFASVTAGKLINLPPTCGSHFTKVVSISRNQASPNRFEITYNFEFGTGVVATQPVTFEAHYGNVPNLLTIIGAENDNTAVAKRGLERRNLFSSFNEWLQKVSSVTVESSQTFEMRQSFDEILFDAKGQCIRDGHRLTSEIQVAISGSAFARGTFGVYVAGHLAPTPKIDTAYVYFKAESGARVELDMFANVNYEKQDVARLATLHLTPFQIPGVGSIGPLLELDIGYDARFSMHGAFKAAVDVNIPPLFVAYGDQEASTASTSDAVTGNADHASGSGVDNIIQPSLRVDFQAGGSVQVFVIPKATLDIDLLEGALDAQVGLSAQAGLTGTLTAEASAGTGQDARASACLGLDANFGVNLLAQGTAFWTKSATQQMSLYTMSPLQLFKKCFGTGTEDANQGNNSTTTPGTGGPVLQLPGGNDGSTAVARRTSDMNVRGGMKRRLISRVNRLKKRSTPLFSLNVDLCPAEGSQGQDPPPPSCPLPPRTRRDGGAQPHNGTSLVHLQRRVVTVQPGTLFKDQAFFRRVLTPPTDRPEDRGWPFLKSKDVFFQGENVGKTLHHIIPWQRINEVFRKVIFVEGPPSPEGKTWQMQCPSLLGNLIQLVENPDPDRKFNAFSDEAEKKFKLFLQAMNADAPSIEAHMRASTDPALQLNADTDVFKIGEDFDMMGAWFPFNIFVGPVSSKRLDDPGEEFETGARCVFEYVCDDRLGGKMWTLLEQLNSYLKPGATTDAATLDKFCQLLTTLVDPNTGQGFTPWPYAEDRWERPTGTVSKGKKGSQKILQLKKCDDVSRTNVPL